MAPKLRGKVRDPRRGTANHTANSSGGEYDYNPPNVDDISIDDTSWAVTTNAQGQPIAQIEVYDDDIADGTKTLILSVSEDANFGFSKEMFILNEGNDTNGTAGDNLFFGTNVSVPLDFNSSIKTATIVIEDNDSIVPKVVGNNKNNSLKGSNGNDAIYGGVGNDTLNAQKGDDNLYGEAGNDTVNSEAGNDYLNGGSGKDKLYGAAGEDTLEGLTGDDSLYGGAGTDNLYGWDGNDYLSGDSGDDYLFGDAGKDLLKGGDGDDILVGGDSSDTLIGDKGNDTLGGGEGKDTLTGGAGADSFFISYSDSGIEQITDFNQQQGDKLLVSISFPGNLTVGDLSSAEFTIGSAATDLSHRFIYNPSTGALFFDQDGLGSEAQIQVAKLAKNLPLVSSDISVDGGFNEVMGVV